MADSVLRGRNVAPKLRGQVLELDRQGFSKQSIAKETGLGYSTVRGILQNIADNGQTLRAMREEEELPAVRTPAELCPEALRALDDFAYFRRRYFGRIPSPWQVEAAEIVLEKLQTEDKEYLVLNAPPGVGKSTTFTHDIPAWLTARNRTLRGLCGSASQSLASKYTNRLRRTFSRATPQRNRSEDVERGWAFDAEACMAVDYGRFKPKTMEIWTREAFVVAQVGDLLVADKEMTWTAYGPDTEQLGERYVFVVWDDLVTRKSLRTVDSIKNQQEFFTDEAESRLEPGGLFLLQGQRMGANDLYRFALDMLGGEADEEDAEVSVVDLDEDRKKYHHVIFKAHYEDRCESKHKKADPPYPEGCLLDPIRLTWTELSGIKRRGDTKYQVVYQQEDTDPAHVLVQREWINGNGEFPGCLDENRALCELPLGLSRPLISVATADPSPSKFWSIQWWVVHPETGQRFLMDLERRAMQASDFLDWNRNLGDYTGLMDEWQHRSRTLGVPITHWIVETNAAARFMLQYDHVKQWKAKNSVVIIGHETHRNKSDPELGITSLAPHYQFGRVRLPMKQRTGAREASLKLIDEVTRWPDGNTDDCVMAQWFLEWNLPRLITQEAKNPKLRRPHWMKKAS